VGTLRAMTGTPPIPLAAVTEEDIHAQSLLGVEFEFVQPAGLASFFHFAPGDRLGDGTELHILRQGG
jgi:hypothetical protein